MMTVHTCAGATIQVSDLVAAGYITREKARRYGVPVIRAVLDDKGKVVWGKVPSAGTPRDPRPDRPTMTANRPTKAAKGKPADPEVEKSEGDGT